MKDICRLDLPPTVFFALQRHFIHHISLRECFDYYEVNDKARAYFYSIIDGSTRVKTETKENIQAVLIHRQELPTKRYFNMSVDDAINQYLMEEGREPNSGLMNQTEIYEVINIE